LPVLVLKHRERETMVMEEAQVEASTLSEEEDSIRPASLAEELDISLEIAFKGPNVTIALASVILAKIVLNRSDVHVTRVVLKVISLAIVLEPA